MKKMKRLMTVLLAAVMMLACGITAWALNGYATIELKGGNKDYKYHLYQILAGDVTTITDYSGETPVEKKIITNPVWGSTFFSTSDNEGFKVLDQRYNGRAEEYVKRLEEEKDPEAAVKELLDTKALGLPSFTSGSLSGRVVFQGVTDGYYLFTETPASEADESKNFVSAPILFLVDGDKNITGAIKGSGATVKKHVAKKGLIFGDGKRDNVLEDFAPENTSEWVDAESYAVGQEVFFLLRGEPSSDVSSFSTYHMTFQDAQDGCFDMPLYWLVDIFEYEGRKAETIRLNYDQNYLVQQSVDGVSIRVERVAPEEEDDDFAIKVTLEAEDGGMLPDWCNNLNVYLRYSSKLNDKAVIGNPGNRNSCYVQTSSDPQDESKVEKSSEDSAYVFCSSVVIDKIDAEGKPLAGADFKLFRYTGLVPVANAKKGSEYQFDTGVERHQIADDLYYVEINEGEGVKTVSPDGTRFTFSGLPAGEYVLVETKIPAGYTPMESKQFYISTKIKNELGIPSISLETQFNIGEYLFEEDPGYRKMNGEYYRIPSGEAYTEIVNNSGSFLPETGGMGTTLFYVLGTLLVTGAGVIMVARRRMAQ